MHSPDARYVIREARLRDQKGKVGGSGIRNPASDLYALPGDLYAENNGVPPEDVDTNNMDAFYILQGAYIDAAFEQAVEDYGSMEAYIREGLGITDEEVESLRSELLE